ncbi:strigolactone esterase D14-like protein [Pyrus ussuriensis x Pyrus communis]|uniref:Strigolactone esterase D14-like protein n=1 Tax=Pyrus ussuriensis x Pyrus communis TaxID=2448454 RepID=A0A5N5GBG5_9ROSA|nr:strigolactone esterase D14-like protein [Pyrus ussuriensis x Pyrus communis]
MEALCQGGGIVQALNTHVYGNGTQTLVLAHGFGSDHTVWHFLIPFPACYFKVVVFDWVYSPNVDPKFYDPKRYSNFSAYADDLVCLLNHLNVSRTVYMGHSMAAMVGCIASIQRPHLFQHLILLKNNFTNWVSSSATTAIGVNDTSAITEFENILGRMKPRIAVSVARVAFLSDYRGLLPQVIVPCSIIQSRKDFIIPKSVAFYMKKQLRGPAKVKILSTEGHIPQLTAYSLLLKVIKKLLHIK